MNQALTNLERHLVAVIRSGLESQEINAAQASSIAQASLENLKADMGEYRLYQAAVALSSNFPALKGIAAEAGNNYEDAIRDAVVRHTAELIRQGSFEEAASLLEAALTKKQEIQTNG